MNDDVQSRAADSGKDVPATGVSTAGQIALGDQVIHIGAVQGAVVHLQQYGAGEPTPRPIPRMLPRRFPNLIDRQFEQATVLEALYQRQNVEITGENGIGKTSLLRHLVHQVDANSFPDGIVWLSGKSLGVDDILRVLFDSYYETPLPMRLSTGQIRNRLINKEALIVVDDAQLRAEQLEILLDTLPFAVFILVGTDRQLMKEARHIALAGLSTLDGMELIAREYGRPLGIEEQRAAARLVSTLNGHPLRILQVAARAREEHLPLADIEQLISDAPGPQAVTQLDRIQGRRQAEREVINALALLNGQSASMAYLQSVTGLEDVHLVLQTLEIERVVQYEDEVQRYLLAGRPEDFLVDDGVLEQLEPYRERALDFTLRLAENSQFHVERLLPEVSLVELLHIWLQRQERFQEALWLVRATAVAVGYGDRLDVWSGMLEQSLASAATTDNKSAAAWLNDLIGMCALFRDDRAKAQRAWRQSIDLYRQIGHALDAQRAEILLAIAQTPPAQQAPDISGAQFKTLVDQIRNYYSVDELVELCRFHLDLDYEDLSGSSKRRKTMELVDYFRRRDDLPALIAALTRTRPKADWNILS